MQQPYEEIVLPSELKDKEGHEFLRVGVVEPDLQVVLQTCFEDPADWGSAAVEILQYAAKAYERIHGIKAENAYGKMVEKFAQMMKRPVDDADLVRVGDH